METTIENILRRLDRLIGDGPARCHFNNPASKTEIAAFEKRMGIKLPSSYKTFLEYTNGGMIVSEELHSMIVKDKDLETAKWNANYLMGLAEIEENYTDMESWNFGLPGVNIATYPFIPFCHTEVGERLVFINLGQDEEESPILDAFHEETPETWGLVADNFAEFLDDYIDTYGDPKVLGDLEKGSALDLIEPMIEDESEPKRENESKEETIGRTTTSIKINPDDHWAYIERGMAYKDLGDNEKALEDFNLGISLSREDAFYYYCRGELFIGSNMHRAALIDFDTAAKLNPTDVLYLNMRAEVLWQMNKFDKALIDANKAVALDPKSILAYMVREGIYRSLGEDEKANADRNIIENLKEESN